MTRRDDARSAALRRVAEARLRGRAAAEADTPSSDDARRLLHELEVHCVELEVQNEELLAARAATDEALAEAADLFESAPVAYFALDAQGRVQKANAAALALVRRAPEAVLGRPLASFFSSEDAHEVAELFATGREGPRRTARALAVPTGRAVPTFVELELTQTAAHAPLRAVAIDVSERRRAERRLREAETMAAIGRLAAGVAHDFNNVLAVMFGEVELTLATELPRPSAESLQRTLEAAGRAKALTRQLLAFGRGQPSRPTTIDLEAFVASLAGMLGRLLGDSIELVCELDVAPAWVRIDPSHLDQIVVNLVLNARDAMPDGGRLRLATAIETGDHGEDVVRLSVEDTGLGIDAEACAHVFEPFFTTKRDGHRAGVGLATVWTFVNGAGGTISVQSERFHGTTMEVRLPLVAAPTPSPPEPRARPAHGGGETILLVDDEPALLRVVERALVSLGFTVLCASCGEDAIDVASTFESRIHLVLTDVHMPGMSGGKLTERLRASRPDIRAVLMSGNIAEEDGRIGSEASAPLLGKPFNLDELAQAIRKALDA